MLGAILFYHMRWEARNVCVYVEKKERINFLLVDKVWPDDANKTFRYQRDVFILSPSYLGDECWTG